MVLLCACIHAGIDLCGVWGCKNRPAPFPDRMSYKAAKLGLVSVLYLTFIILYCCLLGPLLCIASFRCCVFCLLVVLVKLSVLAKWLARKIPLKKPNRGKGIISRKPRQKSAYDFLGLLYCFIVVLCICVVSCPYVMYFPIFMARYSLFVLKVPLNPKQTNKQTCWHNKKMFLCGLLTDESSQHRVLWLVQRLLDLREPSRMLPFQVSCLLISVASSSNSKSEWLLCYCMCVCTRQI